MTLLFPRHYNCNSVKYISKVKIVQITAKFESAYIRMKTIGIVAEFNPFHNGHLHLLNNCKELFGADHLVIVMSGDFVQRGTPAMIDKFARTKMALECGADIAFVLPAYYSSGSAEYFARGAISILDNLGCINELAFGSECDDVSLLTDIAKVLVTEPDSYKEALSQYVKEGNSFAASRQKALISYLSGNSNVQEDILETVLNSPNNILGIEYIKAIITRNSRIKPVTIKRIGEDYNSDAFGEYTSATAIRKKITESGINDDLSVAMPAKCVDILKEYSGRMADADRFSDLCQYKLLIDKDNGYTRYLDVSNDLSNKICSSISDYSSFDGFIEKLKSKDLAYSRISRSLTHILLNITQENMDEYKAAGYTCYARILGMKASSSSLVKVMNETSSIPVISNLKKADSLLSPLSYRLLKENLMASEVYNSLCTSKYASEYSLKQLVL